MDLAFASGFIDQISMPKTSLLRVQAEDVSYTGLHATKLQQNQSESRIQHELRSRTGFSFGDYHDLKGTQA